MSDNLYEKFDFSNTEEKAETIHHNEDEKTASDHTAPQQGQDPVREPSHYADPYAGRVSYRQPLQQQYETPKQDNPYVDPYRPSASYSRPETAQTPTPAQPKREPDDGFYHYSRPAGSRNVYSASAPRADESRNVYSGSSVNTGESRRAYTDRSVNTSRPSSQWQTTDPQPEKKQRKKSGGGLSKGSIALLLVICVIISGLAGFGGSILASKLNASNYETTDGTMVVHKVNTEIETSGKNADKTTEEITNEVADSVVEITTEVVQTNSVYGQYIAQGAGSGVIISDDGYIVTNNHVIEGANSIKVTTRGGDSYDAKLIGTDSKVDIALLKIEATGLPVAVVGDSSKLNVGSKAVIIGNPLGTLGGSVTEGIISALDRSIVIDGKTMHLMQTDAAINPGNSGGGMFDGQGTLCGIVVAKSSSEEIDNIGFVIPINNVMEVIGDLKDYGYVRGRADTGMTFMDLSNNMYAWYYYGTSEAGVYINSVENGSNAAKAGFAKGDIVLSIDGNKISSSDDITSIISEKSAGDKVTFEISRGGKTQNIELELEEDVPDTTDGNSSQNSNQQGQGNNRQGSGNSDNGGSNPFSGTPFSGLW